MFRDCNYSLRSNSLKIILVLNNYGKLACHSYEIIVDLRTWQNGGQQEIIKLHGVAQLHIAQCMPLFSPQSAGTASPGGGVFLLFLLIRVAADGDDTDGGAGGVRDDNRLSLSLPCGAGGHVTPPTGD